MTSTDNGNNLTFKWLSSILILVIFSLVGLWGRGLAIELGKLTDAVSAQGVKLGEVEGQLKVNGDRLGRIETNQDQVLRSLPRVPR